MRIFLLITLIFTFYSCEESKEESSLSQTLYSEIGTNLIPLLQFDDEEIEHFTIEERLNALNIAGVSIAVAKGKKIIYSKAFGLARKKDSIEMDTKTIFQTGSISKLFTSAIILKMVEKGQLELDKPVNDYLTEWQVPESVYTKNEKVTIRRLLEHTSGINGRASKLISQTDSIPRPGDLLTELDIKLINIPGEKYTYSANNFLILQLLIEELNGSFIKAADDKIIHPLGLNHSSFHSQDQEINPNIASSYLDDGSIITNSKYADVAGEGLWSTPSELLKYITEVQYTYQTKNQGFFQPNTIEELQIKEQSGNHLGLALNEHTFGFAGNTMGSSSKVIAWKDFPYSIAISANGYSEALINEISYEIANTLDLPIEIEPTVYNVVELTNEQFERIIGLYKPVSTSPLGALTIHRENDKIRFSFEDENVLLNPKPINDSTFVDSEGYFHRMTDMNSEKVRIVCWEMLEYEKIKN